jgi:hypothetical protein
MRRIMPILLLAIACNDTHESRLSFPVKSINEVILHANTGSIHVRHPAKGEDAKVLLLLVKESGGKSSLGAKKRIQVTQTKKRIRMRPRRNEEGLRLDLELVVPKGLTIDIVLRDGDVRIEGEFATVAATVTNGNINATLNACDGAVVRSRVGDVTVKLLKPKLKRDVRCETLTGNASLEIPSGFRGPINLESASAKLDLGDAPKVALLVDASRTSARGFAGTPMTSDERVEAEKTRRWPPGVRAKSQTGTVLFRVQ